MCKLAIIGCGNIAKFHVPAMQKAGFRISAISGRAGTKDHLHTFASTHGLVETEIFETSEDLLASDSWDALLLSCPTSLVLKYIKAAVPLNKPVLAEKPVSQNAVELTEFLDLDNVKVAYNRRFYKTVEFAKDFIATNEVSLVKVAIPERSDELSDAKTFPQRLPANTYENSVHMADLLLFLFGNIEWTHKENVTNSKNYKALVGVGRTQENTVITLDSCFNSSDNFSVQIISGNKRLELKPLESAQLYNGMNVEQPTMKVPIRRYLPVLERQMIETDDSDMKSGFELQAVDFMNFCRGKNSIGATIYDSYRALVLLEELKK